MQGLTQRIGRKPGLVPARRVAVVLVHDAADGAVRRAYRQETFCKD
ncbi:hypothetical protein Bsp3421_006723 [Burkholderia sp. FERM BP-3421]|nr:hypothetical protein [Burkholderia sp. FERM BP-3421]WDD96509.1 hypothetical protein Bsp3421_006723 [Burkholderia sp. FERM BP-3421]